MSPFTRTDQKFLSFALSSLWKLRPGEAGFIWRSKAVVFAALCSSPVRRARLSVKVSAIRNCMAQTLKTFMTSSPRWLITFTAIRRDFGRENGRDTSEWRLSQASRSISALSVVRSEP